MEKVVAERVNDSLERMRRATATIESRGDKFANATTESSRRMEHWANSVIQTDREHQSDFITGMSELEELRATQEEHKRIATEALEANAVEEEHFRQEGEALHEDVDELIAKRNAVPLENERLRHTLNAEEQRYVERKAHVSQAKSRVNAKVEVLQREIGQMQRALGLQLEVNEDRSICFRFRCIDVDDARREFVVTVTNLDGRFKAVQCEPMIPEFERLNKKLQNDEKLVLFLRDIRGAFVRSTTRRNLRVASFEAE